MTRHRGATTRPPWGIAAALVVAVLLGTCPPGAAARASPVGPAGVDVPVLPAAALAAQTNADQALLRAVRPEVQWSPVGSIRWQPIDGDQVVTVGDRVRTGQGASARLVYFDGTVTELGAETGILVQRLDRSPDGNLIARLFQSAGETLNRVLPAASGLATFEVETPTATARARGTTPRLEVDFQTGTTRVASVPDDTGGLVAVESKDPAATAITLQPGQETTIAPGQAPTPPRAFAGACPGGLLAEYFDNPDLQGTPVLVRCDPVVHFDWGLGSPAPGVPAGNFSARWQGQLTVPLDGSYTFGARVDHGVRLYVDGARILDEWPSGGGSLYTASHFLSRGAHTVVVEYVHAAGAASVRIDWPLPPD
jgi:hypothetical protein